MATPFFGKRETETPTNLRHGQTGAYGSSGSSSTSQPSATAASTTRPNQ